MGFYYPDPSTSYYLQNINGKRFLYASDSGSMSGGAGVLAGVEDLFQVKHHASVSSFYCEDKF